MKAAANKLSRKRAAAQRKWDKRAREIRREQARERLLLAASRTPESYRTNSTGDLPDMEIPTR
jgi:hypothetical protein